MIEHKKQKIRVAAKLFTAVKHYFHTSVVANSLVFAVLLLQGCTAVNTFPTIARPGDTVSVMVGGSENARKDTISATLTDSNNVVWNLQTLGLVRSVFNLRTEGRAYGLHYSDFVDINAQWKQGREPIQTVLVFDIPNTAAIGPASLSVDLNTTDDSSAIPHPFVISMDIVDLPGQLGGSDNFLRQNFDTNNVPVNLSDLEPAPHAKISFGKGAPNPYSATPNETLGAAELVVDFDGTVVNGDDLDVYVADTTTQRGTIFESGPFGENQRMVYWRRNGNQLLITIIAPKGIEDKFLQIYIVHPRGLAGDPELNLVSTTAYDLNGNLITATPLFTYYP